VMITLLCMILRRDIWHDAPESRAASWGQNRGITG